MPTGKVKFFDTERGFGFVSSDDGGDVYVPKSALPSGLEALKPGQRIEFGIVEGRKGAQALSVRVLDPLPSVVKATRRKPDDLQVMVEDLIKLLDSVAQKDLRRGRYPDRAHGKKIATVLRALADEIEQ